MPTVRARDLTLYYELDGPDTAPAVVLNNGILMTTGSWAMQVPALSCRHRVVRYDMRGQGRSDHPDGPYSMAQHADDLAALLDHLGLDRVHVAGISYGGEVAQAFALAHPARLRSLLLADTVSEVGPELRLSVEAWRRAAERGDGEALFELSVPWNFSPAFVSANPALLADARRRYRDLDLPAVVRLCDAFLGVDFTSRLGAITAPTCVVVGERDVLKGRDYAETIQRAIPGAQLHVLPGAGHAACWERPAEFNPVLLGFLALVEDAQAPQRP